MPEAQLLSLGDRLLSVSDIAEALGRSPQAIYDLRHRGVLPPALRIGARLYWLREDVEKWLQESREEVTTP